MKLTIEAVRTPALRMREDIFATVLKYLGREYMLMLSGVWGFKLKDEKDQTYEKIVDRIDLERENLEQCLEKYTGIWTEYIEWRNTEEQINIIQQELEKSLPVLINVNSASLPYHRTYKNEKLAHPHQVLLIGIKGNAAFILDPPWEVGIVEMPLSDLKENLYHIELFRLTEQVKNIELEEVFDNILKKVYAIKNGFGNMFESIQAFADIIEKEFDINQENDGEKFNIENLRFNPFIFSIDEVGRLRLTMSDVFRYIADYYKIEECIEIADEFSQLAQAWTRIRYVLIRECCNQENKSMDKIRIKMAGKIREIVTMEKKVAEHIESLKERLEGKGDLSSSSFKGTDIYYENTIITPIDLSNYLNNCAFHNSKNGENRANFNISEVEYFISDSLTCGEEIEKADLKFKLPNLYKDQMDNVYCNGQKIEVEEAIYTGIQVLGFSIYKGYAGVITIHFEDDSIEEINFAISNSGAYKPLYGEYVILEPDFYSKGNIHHGSVFGNEYKIKTIKKIKAIELPDWELFSIVALSLRRVAD